MSSNQTTVSCDESFTRSSFKNKLTITAHTAALMLLTTPYAHAADFEGSLRSLVSAVVTRIMPLCALPFLAKAAFGYVQGDPMAVAQTPKVVVGVVALLGVNGVWAFLQSHVR